MDKLKYKARAKVNLGLDVCGRLPNGYHKVKMIMQAIDLYDELEFNKRKDPGYYFIRRSVKIPWEILEITLYFVQQN